ncbi:FAD-binding oxidoreductase [Pseudomonas sp. HK3]|jgi:4-cresol dehydrogenase (hydroxylating)
MPEFKHNISLLNDDSITQRYKNSGLINHLRSVSGVTFPESCDDVVSTMHYCIKNNLHCYPISSGRNWGYGGASAVLNDALIVDFKRMNNIRHFDDVNGVVDIEPGVTQGQLANYLKGSSWMIDCTGAGPDTSIVGNVLERGFGHGSNGNRSQHFTIKEAVLADGQIISLDDHKDYVGRAGLSAGLQEIFTQNNLAVVTCIRFELSKVQEESARCLIRLASAEKLPLYIDKMAELKAEGTIDTLPHLGNSFRMFGVSQQFDFSKWDSKKGITEGQIRNMLSRNNIAPWSSAFIVSGAKLVTKAKIKRIKEKLKGVAIVNSISLKSLIKVDHFMGRIYPLFKRSDSYHRFQKTIRQLTQAMIMFEGNPDGLALKGCYWRHASKQPSADQDPVMAGCGFYWIAPALPMKGEVVNNCIELTKSLYEQYGFEFAVTLTSVTSHMCQAIVSLYFNKEDEDETLRAKVLIDLLREKYRKEGWICYRRSIDEMPFGQSEIERDAITIRQKIKSALDPDNIISPGRYE